MAFASRIGAGADTVTDSVTAAMRSVSGASAFRPAATMTSRCAVLNPESDAASLYRPGSRLRKRNVPSRSVTNG